MLANTISKQFPALAINSCLINLSFCGSYNIRSFLSGRECALFCVAFHIPGINPEGYSNLTPSEFRTGLQYGEQISNKIPGFSL